MRQPVSFSNCDYCFGLSVRCGMMSEGQDLGEWERPLYQSSTVGRPVERTVDAPGGRSLRQQIRGLDSDGTSDAWQPREEGKEISIFFSRNSFRLVFRGSHACEYGNA